MHFKTKMQLAVKRARNRWVTQYRSIESKIKHAFPTTFLEIALQTLLLPPQRGFLGTIILLHYLL